MDTQRTAAALGVDFGTHHTVATVLRVDGRRHQLLFEGSPLLPSGIYIDNDASLLVGRDAVREGRRHPGRYERNPKLRIGSPSILLGDKDIPIREAVSAVIGRVLSECERVAGPPQRVTVTVPAGWGPARRHVIGDAAASTGAAALTLLPEPVAAARYFVEVLGHELEPGRSVVVFDLGAGTFDASAVARTAAGYEVLAVDGSDRIGGHYLDQAIVEYIGGRYEASEELSERWRSLMDPHSGAERQRLRFALYDEVRDAKERLSRTVTADVVIPGFAAEELLTRSELELLARPLLEQAVAITRAVVREAGLEPERLAGIFMVGGASRMPLATTMLHQELGVAPTLIEEPELVVSEGAVTAGAAPAPPVAPPVPTQVMPAAVSPNQSVPPAPSPATPTMPPAPTQILPPAPPPDRRSPALLIGIIALALAVLGGIAAAVYAYGNPSGTITGIETDTSEEGESAEPGADDSGTDGGTEGDEAADWDSAEVVDTEITTASITVFTNAEPSMTGCSAAIDGPHQSRFVSELSCTVIVFEELYASSPYEIWIYGPGQDREDPESTPIIERHSTTAVTGTVYWDCPQTLHYCQEQGGEPGVSPEPERGHEAVDYAAVGEVFDLVCYTEGDEIVPRGSDEIDGYHDYHPGKNQSNLWIRLEHGPGRYGYMPFVWLIVDGVDLNSTGELPAC